MEPKTANGSTVAFIGVGRMGRPICGHLLRAGFKVRMYDVDPNAMVEVEEQGGIACGSAAEAAETADAIIVMLGYFNEVREALSGKGGVLERAKPGSIVIVGSTISPNEATRLSDSCAAAGVRFVDAPVCMGETGAVSGELVWLVGGEDDAVAASRPFLEPSAKHVFHLGGVGAGMVGKCVNNMLLWAAFVADSEGFALAERYGVSLHKLTDALMNCSAMNYPMKVWFEPKRIPWAHKDMKIVLDMADEVDLVAPMAALLREQVKPLMSEAGLGNFTYH